MSLVAVGIDVGLLTGKGLDVVALDDSRRVVDTRNHIRDVADIVVRWTHCGRLSSVSIRRRNGWTREHDVPRSASCGGVGSILLDTIGRAAEGFTTGCAMA